MSEEVLPILRPSEELDFADLYDRELELAKGHGSSMQEWYLSKTSALDAIEEKIQEQAKIMLAQVASQRRALQWRHGDTFRLAVESDIAKQGGKKKSVDYATGRAGFRKKPSKLKIVDEPTLKAWCLEHCDSALELKIARTTPIKEHFEKSGELAPGCQYVHEDNAFYPAVDPQALPERESIVQLPEGTSNDS